MFRPRMACLKQITVVCVWLLPPVKVEQVNFYSLFALAHNNNDETYADHFEHNS